MTFSKRWTELEDYCRWYSRAFNLFNINRFAYNRAAVFRYSQPRPMTLRPVVIWSMDDVKWTVLDYFANQKIHFYVTTERYDWKRIDRHPKRFGKGGEMKKWRNEVFKKALEEADFVLGKDVVFELDCAGHKHRAEDWAAGISVNHAIIDQCKSIGIRTLWDVFSGSGGFHIWVPWEEVRRFYEETTEFKENGMNLVGLSEFTKSFSVEVPLAAGAKPLTKTAGTKIGNVAIDLAPNARQGVIRCPYTIHPKTGCVVLPLDKRRLESLTSENIYAEFSVRKVLRDVRLKNRGMPTVL